MTNKYNDEVVTLWTRQNINSLDDLNNNGVYRVKLEYIVEQYGDIAEHYLNLYSWFVNAASSIVPIPNAVKYPIWCNISSDNMLKPIENTVIYELNIRKSKVIYFDGGKWDFVLNHLYIPKDEKDYIKYKMDMEARGFKDIFSFIEGKYSSFYPQEKKRIIDSWIRIFEIDNWSIFNVQANIWEIRPEYIRRLIY